MTYEEAVKISGIIEHADGGCQHCVTSLLHDFMTDFPDLDWDRAFAEGAKGDHYWKPVEVIDKARRS